MLVRVVRREAPDRGVLAKKSPGLVYAAERLLL